MRFAKLLFVTWIVFFFATSALAGSQNGQVSGQIASSNRGGSNTTQKTPLREALQAQDRPQPSSAEPLARHNGRILSDQARADLRRQIRQQGP
jgi:hypothetical protein